MHAVLSCLFFVVKPCSVLPCVRVGFIMVHLISFLLGWTCLCLSVLQTGSFRVGQGPGSRDGTAKTGFFESEAAAHDFVAHFFSKSSLGIIFSADLRVTGFYKDRDTGKMLPAEESGMIRNGDQVCASFFAPNNTSSRPGW